MATTVPVIITYRKPGTQPPLFVAGTFSDPQWLPLEMDYTSEDGGEHVFTKEIQAKPQEHIQYKFRLGPGDWWVLNEDAPTVTDALGNQNNMIEAPSVPAATTSEVSETTATLYKEDENSLESQSSSTQSDASQPQQSQLSQHLADPSPAFLTEPPYDEIIALPSYGEDFPGTEDIKSEAEVSRDTEDLALDAIDEDMPNDTENMVNPRGASEENRDEAVQELTKSNQEAPKGIQRSQSEEPMTEQEVSASKNPHEPQGLKEWIPVMSIPSPLAQDETSMQPASDEDEGVSFKSYGRPSDSEVGAPKLSAQTGLPNGDTAEQGQPATSSNADVLKENGANSTATDTVDLSNMTKRNVHAPADRPVSPSKSLHGVHDKKGTWLGAFVRLMFVEFIGSLFGKITRLLGGSRKALLVTSTMMAVLGFAWWQVGQDWGGRLAELAQRWKGLW